MATRQFLYTEVTDPTVNDDTDLGFKVGDEWLNTAALRFFKAMDVTNGAAVWLQFSQPSSVSDLMTGWVSSGATWSYSSADSPTFVISVNADMTGLISVGNRIRLVQTTTKYFIVTAVGTYSAGATLITVYGGTDYTLANAAITSPYYSHMKSPFGFPTSPAKWTVTATNTSFCQKTTPTANVWYGDTGLSPTGISIAAPIGIWNANIRGLAEVQTPATAASYGVRWTLSTASNSESDALWSSQGLGMQPAVLGFMRWPIATRKLLALTSKTTHYLNVMTGQSSVVAIGVRGEIATTTIELVCGYL